MAAEEGSNCDRVPVRKKERIQAREEKDHTGHLQDKPQLGVVLKIKGTVKLGRGGESREQRSKPRTRSWQGIILFILLDRSEKKERFSGGLGQGGVSMPEITSTMKLAARKSQGGGAAAGLLHL